MIKEAYQPLVPTEKSFDGTKPLIKNTIVERMFMDDATDHQMRTYVDLATSGATHRATAYASRIVEVWHNHRRNKDMKLGVDHEYTAHVLFERGKSR